MLARRDPWTNIMRLTAASFAAACGGADSVAIAPFTAALGGTNALSRRLTRNIPLVLAHECRLGRVADPARGSFHHETLTDTLARQAWTHFQEIQAEGTLEKFIVEGRLHAAVAQTRAARTAAFKNEDAVLIGVTAYPPSKELEAAHPLRLDSVDHDAARKTAETRSAARKPPATRAARPVPDQLIPLARDGADVSTMLSPPTEEHEPYHETPLRPMRDAAAFEAAGEAS
jgi:methylmalonyl-CoA mutase